MTVSRTTFFFTFTVLAVIPFVGCGSSASVAEREPAAEWQVTTVEGGVISCDGILVVSETHLIALTDQRSDTLASANVLEIRQFRGAQTTTGMLIGMSVGGVFGYAVGPGEKPKPPSDSYFDFDMNIGPSKKSISAIGGVLVGGLVGGLIGSTSSGDRVLELNKVPSEKRGYVVRSWLSQ